MPREARVHFDGAIFHVIARGNNKEKVFQGDLDKQRYLDLLVRYKSKFGFNLYAFVLMNNHVHLVIRVHAHPLAKVMQCLQLAYTKYFNGSYEHVGHVFQQRYKAFLCQDDRYLMTLIRYIHHNPVRAGLTENFDYQWSSHGYYLAPRQTLVDVEHPLSILANKKDEAVSKYLELVKTSKPTVVELENDLVFHRGIATKTDCNSLLITLVETVSVIMGVPSRDIFLESRNKFITNARDLVIFLAVKDKICLRRDLADQFKLSYSTITRAYNNVLVSGALTAIAEKIEQNFKEADLLQA